MNEERLTWKEIQEKYPDQWVGLTDVEYYPEMLSLPASEALPAEI